MKKLPLGVSTFSEIIEEDYIYVDKTRYIHEMISTGKVYFLSRPRRFGKSLLVSTLKSLFQGEKDLFKNLYIHDKWDWTEKHPVIHLDFGTREYNTPEELKNDLLSFINRVSRDFRVELFEHSLSSKFNELISEIHKKTGQKVVVLIDEYDKPIIDSMKNISIAKKNRNVLSDFYQVLKASDEHLRFIFLTGVTKFSKTSIFSGLNNITDITLNSNYSMICGYSQTELENCFSDYIKKFTKANNIPQISLLSLIKKWYDGYSWDGKNRLYNPYSILSLFNDGKFVNYWFETGTPSFLMEYIKENPEDAIALFEKNIAIEGNFPDFELEDMDLITLLLQTGYLTIKNENIVVGELPKYELTIPNHEVNISLFTSIIRKISKQKSQKITSLSRKILEAIVNLDNKSLQKYFDILTSSIPAVLYGKVKKNIREANYHIWFLSWFKLMGFFIIGEIPNSTGTSDIIFKKDNLIVICEIKHGDEESLNELAMDAIKQIYDNKYYVPYLEYDVVLLGVAFGNRQIKSHIEPLTNNY